MPSLATGVANIRRARFAIVAAALLWSSGGLFAKAPIFTDWPAEHRGLILAFWRALFGGLVLLPTVRRVRFRPALVPMTLCFAVMNASYLSAVTLTTAANAIWLQMTAPAWVLLIGVLFLRERTTAVEILQLLLGLAGVATIILFQGDAPDNLPHNGVGIGLALLSGLTYGGVVLFLRFLREENASWLIALNLLSTAVLLAPYVVYVKMVHGVSPSPTQFVVVACFGALQIGIPYLLFAYGLKNIPGPEASGLALLEPVLMPTWVLLAWGEKPELATIAGAVLILAGLTVRYAGACFKKNATAEGPNP